MAEFIYFVKCAQLHLPKLASGDSLREPGRETILIHELPLPGNVEKRRLLVHHSMETAEQNNKRLLSKIRERMHK